MTGFAVDNPSGVWTNNQAIVVELPKIVQDIGQIDQFESLAHSIFVIQHIISNMSKQVGNPLMPSLFDHIVQHHSITVNIWTKTNFQSRYSSELSISNGLFKLSNAMFGAQYLWESTSNDPYMLTAH